MQKACFCLSVVGCIRGVDGDSTVPWCVACVIIIIIIILIITTLDCAYWSLTNCGLLDRSAIPIIILLSTCMTWSFSTSRAGGMVLKANSHSLSHSFTSATRAHLLLEGESWTQREPTVTCGGTFTLLLPCTPYTPTFESD